MIHLSDDDLALYAIDRELLENPGSAEAHLAECASCDGLLEAHRRFDESLRSSEPWLISDPASDTHRQSFRAMALQTQREDEDAGRLLASLLESPESVAWAGIVNDPAYQTGGVVRRLCEGAHQTCARVPAEALAMSSTAITISLALPDDLYPAHAVFVLRGMAWKERANALRFLDRFDETIEALAQAESFYRKLASPELDLAIIEAMRAFVFAELDDFDRADESARTALAIFRHLGQEKRTLDVMTVEGCVLRLRGATAPAITKLRQVLELAESMHDVTWQATAKANLAWCYVDAGELTNAAFLFHAAGTTFRELGFTSDVTRCDWGLALVARELGRHREALDQLLDVSASFAEQQVVVDSATAMVEAFEIMLALGEIDRIEPLAAGLVTTLTNAGKMESALTAIAYVKEAAASRSLTAKGLREAHTFLRRSERHRNLACVPPDFFDSAV